jgi:hypothetical protein
VSVAANAADAIKAAARVRETVMFRRCLDVTVFNIPALRFL